MAVSTPSAKGGSSGVPSTKWDSGRGNGRAPLPGSASAGAGISVLGRKRKLIGIAVETSGAHVTVPGTHGPSERAGAPRARLPRARTEGGARARQPRLHPARRRPLAASHAGFPRLLVRTHTRARARRGAGARLEPRDLRSGE